MYSNHYANVNFVHRVNVKIIAWMSSRDCSRDAVCLSDILKNAANIPIFFDIMEL